MKLTLLGGTRFIGREVARLARERGHSVTLLHRGVHPADTSAIREILVDRTDEAALAAALEAERPDVLIDTCAMTRAETAPTVAALRGRVARVVVLSSHDVYAQFGRLNGLPCDVVEDRVTEGSALTIPFPFRNLADHAGGPDYDKKDVEAVYRGSRAFEKVTVLRLPATYGRGDYQRRFASVVDLLDSGVSTLPCQKQASWRFSMGHVTNVAHAIVLAAEDRDSDADLFNVADEPVPPMRERVEAIARGIGVSVTWQEVETLPDELSLLGEAANDFVVDTTRLRSALGFHEILGADERVRDLVEWSRQVRGTERS